MALEVNVTDNDKVFIGEDKQLRFAIFGEDGVTPLDVSGFSFRWLLKNDPEELDAAALITKESPAITVGGVFNVDPLLNTQYVQVPIEDTDTDPIPVGNYHHALKRTDDGSESILAFGRFRLRRAAAH